MLQITPWERAALQLLANGRANYELADRLGVDETEIESHLDSLFTRMGVASPTEALAAAARRGLLVPDEPVQGGLDARGEELRR